MTIVNYETTDPKELILIERVRETPLIERLDKSYSIIAKIFAENRGPKMSIPAQHYDEDFFICQTIIDAAEAIKQSEKPIDMLLYCPNCGEQHVDEAKPDVCETCGRSEAACLCEAFTAWLNPPHKSHRCSACNHVFRPADVPTNGVRAIKTAGERDDVSRPRYAYLVEGLRGSQKAIETLEQDTSVATLVELHWQELEALRAELKEVRECYQKSSENYRASKTSLESEMARLKEVNKAIARASIGEVWYWQGDGTDEPESLTCPVIMSAQDVRKMVDEIERLKLANLRNEQLRKDYEEQVRIVERLKRGDFTVEEFNNLCHNMPENLTAEAFCKGCEDYQKKLFGKSPIKILRDEDSTLKAQLSDAKKDAEKWKGIADQYAKAWQRELEYKLIPKTHLIDSLVLSTRAVIKERNKALSDCEDMKEVKKRLGAHFGGLPGDDALAGVDQLMNDFNEHNNIIKLVRELFDYGDDLIDLATCLTVDVTKLKELAKQNGATWYEEFTDLKSISLAQKLASEVVVHSGEENPQQCSLLREAIFHAIRKAVDVADLRIRAELNTTENGFELGMELMRLITARNFAESLVDNLISEGSPASREQLFYKASQTVCEKLEIDHLRIRHADRINHWAKESGK